MRLLYRAITSLTEIIKILILIRIVISFLKVGTGGTIIRFIYDLTEPVLGPARALIAKTGIDTGMFDFSPIVAILILSIIENVAAIILL